jgi:hypothetical protein
MVDGKGGAGPEGEASQPKLNEQGMLNDTPIRPSSDASHNGSDASSGAAEE